MEGIRENGRAAFAVPLEVLFDAPRWGLSANKMPYTAKAGKPEASRTNDPSLWTTKAEAEAWLRRHKKSLEAKGEVHLGLLLGGEVVEGFVLVGIDVDWKHAPEADGMPAEVALALQGLPLATYTEWSLSGKGLHLLGVLPVKNLPHREAVTLDISEGVQMELYAYPEMGGRYFVWTGRKVEDSPLQLANLAPFWEAALQTEEDKKPKRRLSPHAELARLAAAKEGTRHNTLKEVAAKFAARLLLTPWRSRIEEAARQTGLPEGEIQDVLEYFAEKEDKWAKQRGVDRLFSPLSEAPDGLDLTPSGDAARLIRYAGDMLLYAERRGLYVYDGRIWRLDADWVRTQALWYEATQNLIETYTASGANKSFIERLLDKRTEARARKVAMDARPYMRLINAEDHFDAHEGLLCVQNGIVDLETGRLYPHSPEYLFTHITNAAYAPEAHAPLWEKFLRDVFCGNEPLIAWIQKLVGAAVWGAQREHILPILWGSGANGKSTFLETLKAVLGGFAGSVPLEVLTGAAGMASERLNVQLYGKRLICVSETREDQTLNENRVKAITGGDTIVARYLYREAFVFRPTHIIFLATNHKPRVRSTDYGTWRRIRLIPFTASFRGANADPLLIVKLLTEREGILTWIVKGAQRYASEGLGDAPAEVMEATAAYQRESDPLAEWLETCTEPDPKTLTPAKELYENYCRYMENSGEKPLNPQAWGRRLTEKGYESVKTPSGTKSRKGLKLKAL